MSRDKNAEPQDIHDFPEMHRDEVLDEEGVSQVSVEQFVKYRLPFLLQVKEEMDEGRELTDGELELMIRMVTRAHNINRFVYEHPELKTLIAQVIDLIHDITGEAVHNAEDHRQPD